MPIHEDVVDDLAAEYDFDPDDLVAFLARVDDMWRERLDELYEHYDVVAEDDDRVIFLAHFESAIDDLATRIADEVDLEFDEGDPTPAILFRQAHKRHARRRDFEAFGGRQRAEYAVRNAGVLVVSR